MFLRGTGLSLPGAGGPGDLPAAPPPARLSQGPGVRWGVPATSHSPRAAEGCESDGRAAEPCLHL